MVLPFNSNPPTVNTLAPPDLRLNAALTLATSSIIPNGFDEIQKGDSVVAITSEIASIEELEDIMR